MNFGMRSKPWDSRFNEAGAIEPRKQRAALASVHVDVGFNEAGAIEPRKPQRGPDGRYPLRDASMRPGQ